MSEPRPPARGKPGLAALGRYRDPLPADENHGTHHPTEKISDVSGGVAYAHQVLDGLADAQHTDMVYAVARDVLAAVPTSDAKLAAVTGLRQRLALTGHR